MTTLDLILDIINGIVVLVGFALVIYSFMTAPDDFWRFVHGAWFIIVVFNIFINKLRFGRF